MWLGLGAAGAVRAGLVHYNEAADVDRLLDAVGEVAGQADRGGGTPMGLG